MKKNLYFIGIYKLNVKFIGDYLMVQVKKDNWTRFSEYVKQNREYFIKCLTFLSLQNDNADLVSIINKLVN